MKKIHIVLIVIVAIILLIFVIELVRYFVLKNEAQKYASKEVVITVDDEVNLVGLLDSYGVPYSPEVREGFLTILNNGIPSEKRGEKLDLFNLYINKTWHFDGVFKNNITIGEMVQTQNFSLGFVGHKYDGRIREDLVYSCPDELANVSVKDYVAGLDNPVICYSCSANDLFYYYGFSLEGLNASRCVELISGFSAAKSQLVDEVDSNINTLLATNSNSQVYVFGLYVPSDNFFLQRLGTPVINSINSSLESVCDKYENVHYVDVSCVAFEVLDGDFHPTQAGQRIIAAKVAESINSTYVHADKESVSTLEMNSFETTGRDFSDKAELIANTIIDSGLPYSDYIEASAAIEWAFSECGLSDISACELELIRDQIVMVFDEDSRAAIDAGIDICVIERRILNGTVESTHSSHPEIVQNDKISLISYYE